MNSDEGLPQIVEQQIEGSVGGVVAAADEDVVPAGPPGMRQHLARSFPQPALGAVSRDGVADLARASEAKPNDAGFGLAVGAGAGLQIEAGRALSAGVRCANEIGPLAQGYDRVLWTFRRRLYEPEAQALRLLRPRARRALMMLRPALVAMRARKP